MYVDTYIYIYICQPTTLSCSSAIVVCARLTINSHSTRVISRVASRFGRRPDDPLTILWCRGWPVGSEEALRGFLLQRGERRHQGGATWIAEAVKSSGLQLKELGGETESFSLGFHFCKEPFWVPFLFV